MKLSGLQVFWLMFTFETGNVILLTINPVMQNAKQDVWIAYLIASLLGILIVYIATKTALLYPSSTLVEFSKLILGKWLGTVCVIIYFIQWYSVIGNILREFADFTITILLPKTPPWIFYLTVLLLLIYVTYLGGIEGIGRCSEVFGPIIILSVLLMTILSIKDFDVQQFSPRFCRYGNTPHLERSINTNGFLWRVSYDANARFVYERAEKSNEKRSMGDCFKWYYM